MELFRAHEQWKFRPNDQRFNSVAEMHKVCSEYQVNSSSEIHNTRELQVEVLKNGSTELVLNWDNDQTKLTYFGFNQLCHKVGAPPDYIRTIGKANPDIAAKCLNLGLGDLENEEVQSLIYQPESNFKLCRSIMTPQYKRIWNGEITSKLFGLLDLGWRTPPARPAFPGQFGIRKATADDVLHDNQFSLSIKEGDLIAPAGLYASDHDMFVFLVQPEVYIEDNGTPMYRGFFLWNSEVGSATLGIQTFLYRSVCGNLIVWGASNIRTLKIKHIGVARSLFEKEFQNRLIDYTTNSVFPDINMIKAAKAKVLGKDKDEVVETIVSQKKKIVISQRDLKDAYDIAELNEDEDGAPNTCWGLVQGITRLSQDTKYADARVKLDTEAGKILALAA